MPDQVCTGAVMTCSFGAAPSTFVATPKMVQTNMMDAGFIMDFVPIANVPPFGVCTSMSNPTVASATAAAFGVLTPMPCLPVLPAPWKPGSSTVKIANIPALNNTCTINCMWGGVIQFSFAGQATHQIS